VAFLLLKTQNVQSSAKLVGFVSLDGANAADMVDATPTFRRSQWILEVPAHGLCWLVGLSKPFRVLLKTIDKHLDSEIE
jgi:hypothetical protein